MAWSKIENPKPSASSIGPDMIRVAARSAIKSDRRYIVIKVGAGVAKRAAFHRTDHNCHLMVGSGEEAGQLAISIDDTAGKFIAKRRKDGRYEITVSGHASAAGGFCDTFVPFEREGKLVPMGGGGPSVITFAAGPGFLARP